MATTTAAVTKPKATLFAGVPEDFEVITDFTNSRFAGIATGLSPLTGRPVTYNLTIGTNKDYQILAPQDMRQVAAYLNELADLIEDKVTY